MYRSTESGRRLFKLKEAFNSDGFEILKIATYNGKRGIAAQSRTAFNYDTGKPKKVYYLEGTPYEMGYLLGSLAEDEVSRMTSVYAHKVVFSFIGSSALEKATQIQKAFLKIMYELSKKVWKNIPCEIREEIQGIYDGCKSRNAKTKVDLEHLIVLNIGIDILCSRVYTGSFLKRDIPEVSPDDFDLPMMCNAFAISGKSAAGGCYFGRDFMFPSADVFQDTATMIIYNPDQKSGKPSVPLVSVTAPGMAGSIAAMNIDGIAMGVNMSPGANCDPQNIGTNSLLMVRLCTQHARSAGEAVKIIADMHKGVSWNYIIADGKNDRSCVVEAGASGPEPDFTVFPPKEYAKLLPDKKFIKNHCAQSFTNGIMVRWNDYEYPQEFISFNPALWDYYNKKHKTKKMIKDNAFLKTGFINDSPEEKNCPSSYYFAPQREESSDILIGGNSYIIPAMRYFTMHRWTARIVNRKVDDLQWRYDELNGLIDEMLAKRGFIGMEEAKELISFLTPQGENPGYYSDNPRSSDGKQIRIEGSDSVFDLKKMVVESHYGYYCDKWVKLSLLNYFS